MSSSNQSSEVPIPMQSAISDLAKQISHLTVAQANSGVQQNPNLFETSKFYSALFYILNLKRCQMITSRFRIILSKFT